MIFVVTLTLTLPTPGSAAQRVGDRACGSPSSWLFAGIAELDVEGDVVAVDLHVLDRLAGDEVLAGVRIDDCVSAALTCFYGDAHGCLLDVMREV